MNPITQIKKKIEKLKELDKGFEIFGAKSHRYRLNPTISTNELKKFEKKHQIELPRQYRSFLTSLGNGGVGPYYGINELEKSLIDNIYDDEDLLSKEFEFTESWNWSNKLLNFFDFLQGYGDSNINKYFHQKYLNTSELDVPWQEWKAIEFFSGMFDEEIMNFFNEAFYPLYYKKELEYGVLNVCDYGCALFFKLIVKGHDRGKIWFDERADRNGIRPVKNNKGKKVDFFEWYINWLDESIKSLE